MALSSLRYAFILGVALPLAGCGMSVTSFQGGAQEVTQASKQNYEALKADAQDMVTYHAPKVPKPIAPSYCYRVMQDITCYHTAVAGAEMRLVAYQGPAEGEAQPVLQAAAEAPGQAAAAPVAPVEATSMGTTPALSPLTSQAQPQTDAQKTHTEQSVAHFDAQKPVTVGAAPAVQPAPAVPAP